MEKLYGLLACVVYSCSFTATSLMARYSRASGDYAYNPSTAVAVTYVFRLTASVLLLYFQHGQSPHAIITKWRSGVGFLVPALLYSLYDNLYFVVLKLAEPITWHALSNIKILLTAAAVQLILRRDLGRAKWLALAALTAGCFLLEFEPTTLRLDHSLGFYALFFFTMSCTAAAGVYNEALLKRDMSLSLHLQNIYFYMMAVVINALSSFVRTHVLDGGGGGGDDDDAAARAAAPSMFSGFSAFVILMCALDALGGLSVSFVLKYLGNIAKVFAGASNMLLVSVLGSLLFHTPLSSRLLLAVAIIAASTYFYVTAASPPSETAVSKAMASKSEKNSGSEGGEQ